MSAPALLIADDQPDIVEALRLLFKRDGYSVVTTNSPAGVLGALEAQEFDAALVDLNYARDTTSGREGLDLLARIRSQWPNVPVVVMTAWGSVDSAVEAMRLGARDYVQKPWDNTRLLTTLPQAVITTTGMLGHWLRMRPSKSNPSRPDVVSRA